MRHSDDEVLNRARHEAHRRLIRCCEPNDFEELGSIEFERVLILLQVEDALAKRLGKDGAVSADHDPELMIQRGAGRAHKPNPHTRSTP